MSDIANERSAHVSRQHKRSWLNRRRGQSLIEVALSLPILLLIVSGAIDLGRAFFTSIELDSVLSEGLHYGAAYGKCLQYNVTQDETASSYIDPHCQGTNSLRGRMRFEASQLALPLDEPPANPVPPYSAWTQFIDNPATPSLAPSLKYVWAQYTIDDPNNPTKCIPLNGAPGQAGATVTATTPNADRCQYTSPYPAVVLSDLQVGDHIQLCLNYQMPLISPALQAMFG